MTILETNSTPARRTFRPTPPPCRRWWMTKGQLAKVAEGRRRGRAPRNVATGKLLPRACRCCSTPARRSWNRAAGRAEHVQQRRTRRGMVAAWPRERAWTA